MIYTKYLVKDTDRFDPAHYPAISEDLDVIVASMATMPGVRHEAMLLSFVKDHCLEAEWARTHSALAEMISSKSLPVKNLEALFASAGQNLSFRRQLEEYVRDRFRETAGS